MPVCVLFWGAMLMMLLKEIGQICYHVLDFENVAVGTQATAAISLFYIIVIIILLEVDRLVCVVPLCVLVWGAMLMKLQ